MPIQMLKSVKYSQNQTTQRINTNVNHGPKLITEHQHLFIKCKEYTVVIQHLTKAGNSRVREDDRKCENALHSLLVVSVNIKHLKGSLFK